MSVVAKKAVTVDEVYGFVYWSDDANRRVSRAGLDGSNKATIYSKLSCVTDQMVWCVLL